jgi:hypothetical protein
MLLLHQCSKRQSERQIFIHRARLFSSQSAVPKHLGANSLTPHVLDDVAQPADVLALLPPPKCSQVGILQPDMGLTPKRLNIAQFLYRMLSLNLHQRQIVLSYSCNTLRWAWFRTLYGLYGGLYIAY